jgi:hypothetical protein
MRTAPKTVKECLILDDVEARRLLFMEATETDVIPSALCQFHAPSNQGRKRNSVSKLIEKAL